VKIARHVRETPTSDGTLRIGHRLWAESFTGHDVPMSLLRPTLYRVAGATNASDQTVFRHR
jgi:hypothetical protein